MPTTANCSASTPNSPTPPSRAATAKKASYFRAADGTPIFSGRVSKAKQTPPRVGWSLFRLLGLRQTVRAFSQPYLSAKIVNPISDRLPHNADAQSYLAADTPVVQLFNPTTDTITFHQPAAQQLNFQPRFLEHFAPFRFVYLQPE